MADYLDSLGVLSKDQERDLIVMSLKATSVIASVATYSVSAIREVERLGGTFNLPTFELPDEPPDL